MSRHGDPDAGEDDAPERMSDFLDEGDQGEPDAYEDGDEDHPMHLDGDEDEELVRDPPRSGSALRGRQGPRSSPSSSQASAPAASSPVKASSGEGGEKNKERAQRRPRGNLPNAPVFDGDRRKDAKCFRKYATKVDSYVEIAKNIIDDAEIGLRLHAALEGEAADFLEDMPARVFGVEKGWQVLLKLLRDKFDEKRMHKVGSAMRGFFKLNLTEKSYSMAEVADLMDKAARRCRESNLVIPDEVMVFFFFEHTQLSFERQANLLLRTGGEYDWKKMKQAVELLYENVQVRGGRDRDPGRDGPPRGRQGRAAHEAHHEWNTDLWKVPDPSATEHQVDAWLCDHDPVEALADVEPDELPEEVARELHECFATHRENRQRLAKAVQARGYYVGGKGKGKDTKGRDKGKGGKGKGGKKGGGKARGMSLEELKSKTTCSECGLRGHWRGDPECKGSKRANEASRADDAEEDAEDWYGELYTDEQWQQWESQRYGYAVRRSTYQTTAAGNFGADSRPAPAPKTSSPATTSSDFVAAEAQAVARGVQRLQRKAGARPDVIGDLAGTASQARQALLKDGGYEAKDIQKVLSDASRPAMPSSSGGEALENAFKHFGLDLAEHRGKGVRALLEKDDGEKIDVESLRKAMAVRRVNWATERAVPRHVQSNMRRPPTVQQNGAT